MIWCATSAPSTLPRLPELDRTSTFPWENIKRMGELGLLGVPWAEELGGTGMDQLSYYVTIHELAKVDASHALTISAHTNLGTSPIVDFGTPEQKRRYVPLLASGKVLGGFGLTEPGAGSDAGGTATTAVDKGDHYVLNGSKVFITHAGVGEIFVVTARTEGGKGNKGITSFILTKETCDLETCQKLGVGHEAGLPRTPGSGRARRKTRWAGEPATHGNWSSRTRSSPRRTCWARRARASSTSSRRSMRAGSGIAALSLGIAEGAYEERFVMPGFASSSARPSAASKGCISSWPTWRSRSKPVTHLLYHAAWLKQTGKPFKKEAAMAKLYCSELAMRVTTKAVQVFGGYGYTTDYPVERMMRDAKGV